MTLVQVSRWPVFIAILAGAFVAGRYSVGLDLFAPDPLVGVRSGLTAGGSLSQAENLVDSLKVIGPEDLDAVAGEYAIHLSTLNECAIAPFVDRWTELNLEEAIEEIEAWPYLTKRGIGLRTAIESVAIRDPAGGMELFEDTAQRNPLLRSDLETGLLSGLSSSQSLVSLRMYFESLPEDAMSSRLGMALEQVGRYHGSDAMVSWVDELIRKIESPRLKAKNFARALVAVSLQDPERAADWATANWDKEYAKNGPEIVAEGWVSVAPANALEWIEHVAPEQTRPEALKRAFLRWLVTDRVAAEGWLESENRTAFHDSAISALAESRVNRDADSAMAWCAKGAEPEGREMCYVRAVTKWAQRSPAAAERWLNGSPLNEATRKIVREAIIESRKQRTGRGKQRVPVEASDEDSGPTL